jgi:uncharacterized protein YkwD
MRRIGSPRIRRSLGATLVAALLPYVGACGTAEAEAKAPSPSCRGADLSPSAANSASIAAVTLCLIDRIRTAYHLRPLRSNYELRMLAASQVNDMVSWNYFSDDRPPGLSPFSLVSATRYPAHTKGLSIGQNIGWGTGEYATPASMVAAWMASPGHREIILTREYRDAGVGVAPAVPQFLEPQLPGATYAIEFGLRRF